MKIYSGEDSTNLKIIGRSYPQIFDTNCEELLEENQKRDNDKRFLTISEKGYWVKITKSVKLTDYMSSFMETHSPIFSEKAIEILRSFNLPKYKLIPIKIFRVDVLVEEKKYFIMHFYGNDLLNVNFKKSTFDYLTGGAFLDKSLLKFENLEDYSNKLNNNEVEYSIIQKVVMNSELHHDLFFLDLVCGSARFFTQNLKDAFEKAGISGFEFLEVGYKQSFIGD